MYVDVLMIMQFEVDMLTLVVTLGSVHPTLRWQEANPYNLNTNYVGSPPIAILPFLLGTNVEELFLENRSQKLEVGPS